MSRIWHTGGVSLCLGGMGEWVGWVQPEDTVGFKTSFFFSAWHWFQCDRGSMCLCYWWKFSLHLLLTEWMLLWCNGEQPKPNMST